MEDTVPILADFFANGTLAHDEVALGGQTANKFHKFLFFSDFLPYRVLFETY